MAESSVRRWVAVGALLSATAAGCGNCGGDSPDPPHMPVRLPEASDASHKFPVPPPRDASPDS